VKRLLDRVSVRLVRRPAVRRQTVDRQPSQAPISKKGGGAAVTAGGGVHRVGRGSAPA
jgi:hypothetical protein